jgi:Domain of unknown function (DUF1877)
MACRGVHFALNDDELKSILDAPNDQAILSLVQDEVEERWDEEWLYQADKAWDAIHRCLSDGTLALDRGDYPLKLVILGGRQLYSQDDFIISFSTPEEVRDIAASLPKIGRSELKARYDAIDPDSYGGTKSPADWEYTWENFARLVPFFQKAAAADRAVIFTVDQ